MAFIDRVLQRPSYGWEDSSGNLIVPTNKQLFNECFRRINVFSNVKNWMSASGWFIVICFLPLCLLFVFRFFSVPLLICSVVYGMVVMSTHGTIWLHRYCTHRAYRFSRPLWRILTQHLVIKTFPEELYVISHHVHHVKSDLPGDPYNSKAGIYYCLLADINHQSISKNLDQRDYKRASDLLRHTGIHLNDYKAYLKWGSILHPGYVALMWLLNWSAWYSILYVIGGHGLACAIFSGAMFWSILVRAFNYTGHGHGKEKHKDGIDFDRSNLSVNQVRPGIFSGEWHNNHHLFPGSARAGFLKYQIDLAWIFIYISYKVGMVSSYHDSKPEFLARYYKGSKLKLAKPVNTNPFPSR